ncbi:sulfatase-like hydrolase/transferase [Reichenbachiella versicolor]|uniref:sulfatase-like hydrolase/transferase n=1 Tax=Reichenbachiella versicolor TaxID=1821036 RepID=UPI0013A53F99|nr:sulfatase-like hydrolase/transferase [Reichenbachiella versicolor]
MGATKGSRPNVIIILADDLGYGDVGFNRDESFPKDLGIIPTPNLDKLANQGIICTNAHVAHPFCGPSRTAIMTGLYPHRIGAQYNLPNSIYSKNGIPTEETYFSTIMNNSGYSTIAVGKWHLGNVEGKHQPQDRGFDEFFGFLGGGKNYFRSNYDGIWYKYNNKSKEYNDPSLYNTPKDRPNPNEYLNPLHRGRHYVDRKEFGEEEYLTDILTDQAIDFINRKSDEEAPFMMYLAYNAPHTPLQAPEDEIRAFKSANPNFEKLIRNSSYINDSKPIAKAKTSEKKQKLINKFVDARITYATMVTNLDTNVGRVIKTLEEKRELDNTVIIFFSDNGGYTYSKGAVNYPLGGLKGSVTEGGHRVPFFVHWPDKIKKPATYQYQIGAIDLYPTLVNLAGGKIPTHKKIDGKDFMDKIIAGEEIRPDESLFVMRPLNGFQNAAVISYPYRIVRLGGKGVWKLYDVNVNPERELEGNVNGTTASEIISNLEKQGANWAREFKDVRPAWFDHNRGNGHPHQILWYGKDNGGNLATPKLPGLEKTFNDPNLKSEHVVN